MSVIRKLDSAYPSVWDDEKSVRQRGFMARDDSVTAAAIVISRNEILTALEDENDSGSPEVHSLTLKQRLRHVQFFFLAVTPLPPTLSLSLSPAALASSLHISAILSLALYLHLEE